MSDLIPQRIKTDIGEKTTPLLTFLVKDETGTPVAGTSIVSSSLYGRWTARAYLGDEIEPCGRPRAFAINP